VWAGHIQRTENSRNPKNTLNAKFGGIRKVGRPRGRWENAVGRDADGIIQCCNRKRTANNRKIWRQKIEEAKA
jgi:hypothetical protein